MSRLNNGIHNGLGRLVKLKCFNVKEKEVFRGVRVKKRFLLRDTGVINFLITFKSFIDYWISKNPLEIFYRGSRLND